MKETSKSDIYGSGLKRQLGLFDSTMIMVGIVIGSGIFLTTGIMAKSIPSAALILLAWVVGGLLTLAGALTYAELGAAMPEAGGQYVYLREAYGPLVAFLFGWILFLVYMTGGIAALAVAFAEYVGYFFPFLSLEHILFIKDVNIFGVTLHISLSSGKLVGVGAVLFLERVHFGRSPCVLCHGQGRSLFQAGGPHPSQIRHPGFLHCCPGHLGRSPDPQRHL